MFDRSWEGKFEQVIGHEMWVINPYVTLRDEGAWPILMMVVEVIKAFIHIVTIHVHIQT